MATPNRYSPALPRTPAFTLADGIIVLSLGALLYGGLRLAHAAPAAVGGPDIALSFSALPWYALLSTGRMALAYGLSLSFSLIYGYAAAHNRTAEKLLMPLLDVLQSVPILSFLPVVLLSFSAILPQAWAAELAAIMLIFTSQAWNLTYSFYQSVSTVPRELREAATTFRLSPWLQLRTVALPFATPGLIWNSIMSWAGGWFFLMAAEMFTVGTRDFRLPGLGAYLQTAADAGDVGAVLAGIGTLVVVIIGLDQLLWRPLLAWAEKFRLGVIAGDARPGSWFMDLLSRSGLVAGFVRGVWDPIGEALDARLHRGLTTARRSVVDRSVRGRPSRLALLAAVAMTAVSLYGAWRAVGLLLVLTAAEWSAVGLGLLATAARVGAAVGIALLWTVPVGVVIGSQRRLAAILQPIVQVVASVPATALFPVFLLGLLSAPGGLNLAAILLMLMGTQWYLLFNVIAGASVIPQDLRDTASLLRLAPAQRWRTLVLPALFPYIVTGAITASGGAWNASVVAEYVQFAGQTHQTVGIGALIARATAEGNYALLLGGTLALIVTVVAINRTLWRWLYRLAEENYRLE